jgi:hypothetical protein
MNYTKNLSFLFIPSNLHSNACFIYYLSGLSGMVFEHLRDYFHLEDLMVDFFSCFNFLSYRSRSQSISNYTCVFGTACLLTISKPSSGVCPIAMGKHYLNSQVPLYVFNSATPLQHIFPCTKSKSQLKAFVN